MGATLVYIKGFYRLPCAQKNLLMVFNPEHFGVRPGWSAGRFIGSGTSRCERSMCFNHDRAEQPDRNSVARFGLLY